MKSEFLAVGEVCKAIFLPTQSLNKKNGGDLDSPGDSAEGHFCPVSAVPHRHVVNDHVKNTVDVSNPPQKNRRDVRCLYSIPWRGNLACPTARVLYTSNHADQKAQQSTTPARAPTMFSLCLLSVCTTTALIPGPTAG